jgi:hypothetical protein
MSNTPGAGTGNDSGGSNTSAGTGGSGTGLAGASGAASAGASGADSNAGSGGLGVAGSGGSNTAGSAGAGGGGQTSTGVAFDSSHVAVTGVRGTATPVAATVVKLHNGGASAVQVKGIALGGANAALFQIANAPTFPATLAAGADLSVTVQMSTTSASLPPDPTDKDTGSVMLNGTLTASLDAGSAVASLYGLVLARVNYEPTLGQILTTLGYKLNVGKAQNNWNPNTSMDATMLPGVETGTDEVAASHFMKAGAGMVSMALVARFSPVGPLPYGWYATTTGCTSETGGGGCTLLATMSNVKDAQTSDKARMVKPPFGTGSTTFDPGSSPFGIWVYSDQKTHKYDTGNVANGDYDYSQDALNTPTKVHRFKSYPLKDAAGMAIPQTYLVAVEEAGNGDYQDYVFVLSNVTPMP